MIIIKMSTFNIYHEILDTHNNFYKKYLKEFIPEIDITNFSSWRLSYINYISDVKYYYIKIIFIQYLDDFFPNFRSKEMVINTMQIGYKFWQELLKDKTNEQIKIQFYIFIFISSCFIVIKVNKYYINFLQLENPNKVKQFKNWVCSHNINLNCCFLAERALLKYCNWKINMNSPCDLIDIIYNKLILKYKDNNSIIEKINQSKDLSITLLEFGICEYNIFSEFNEIIICLSSVFICIKQNSDEENNKSVGKIDIHIELKEILEQIINNINIDKNLIESCSVLMLKNLQKDDDNNINQKENNEIKEKKADIFDINSQLDITRTDSEESSFCKVVNDYILDKNFDNIIPDNKDIKKFNFGKISPISPILKEEIISLKEQNENILKCIKGKKYKDKKLYNNIFDEEDSILLNRKRNGNKK